MRTRVFLAAVVCAALAAAGCSKSRPPDECQQVVDKSRPVLKELGEPEARLDALAKACPGRKPGDAVDMLFTCLAAAGDKDTIGYCWKMAPPP